ncbi:MAG TPA: hypothetical protein VK509_22735, partial [Polyangiales bacterium]|nr:hypothetical protein [Polyangiales bacterium]
MSKLKETIALYERHRGELLSLKRTAVDVEAGVAQAEARVQRARDEALAKIERAKQQAEVAAAREIHESETLLADERATLDAVRRKLKVATAALLQAANDVPRLMHA